MVRDLTKLSYILTNFFVKVRSDIGVKDRVARVNIRETPRGRVLGMVLIVIEPKRLFKSSRPAHAFTHTIGRFGSFELRSHEPFRILNGCYWIIYVAVEIDLVYACFLQEFFLCLRYVLHNFINCYDLDWRIH